jgi:hypothetical protein
MLSDFRFCCGSKPVRRLGLMVGLSLALTGCGKFGLDAPGDSTLQFRMGSTGCLDGLGSQIDRFISGSISEEEWKATWNCASTSFRQFRTYARGTSPDGFSKVDLTSLVQGFLITQQPIPDGLISGALRIKSAVLGGNALTLTYDELDQVLDLMDWARDSSARLIPLLGAKAARADLRTLSDLSSELQKIADEFASKLGQGRSFLLTWEELRTLAEQVNTVLKMDLPVNTLFTTIEIGKGILLSGDRNGIETKRIAELIRMMVPAASVALELKSIQPDTLTGPNEKMEFYLRLAESLKPILVRALELHGGMISLEWFDRALDLVPESYTTTPRGHIMDRNVLKNALRNANWRFLRSQKRSDLDAQGVEQIYKNFREFVKGQTLIDRIFVNVGGDEVQGINRQVFLEAADRLYGSLATDDQVRLSRLVDLVTRFPAMFVGNDQEIMFKPLELYSKSAVSKLHLYQLISQELMLGYSTHESRQLASIKDIETLVAEWLPVLVQIQKIDPTIPLIHERRFREGNLFSVFANGDPYLDIDEATYYLQQISSIGALTSRIMAEVNELCGVDSYDVYGARWMRPRCFREAYFNRYEEFWDHMPALREYYSKLDARGRRRFEIALEQGGRRFGYSDAYVGEYDVSGYVGVSQYVESIFNRFDNDRSSIIQLNELMKAFPVFKRELAAFGKIDINQTLLLEGAFTYTVRYGIAPTTDFMGTSHFLGWIANKPFWQINADRTALYRVLAALNPIRKEQSDQVADDLQDAIDDELYDQP